MRIWKWTLTITDLQSLEMPHGAKIITVQVQHGEPQLWALCDENAEKEKRNIAIYGTGNPVPDVPGTYIGTFQVRDGLLVFHVFDKG
jgi:hypothetical protein